MKLRQLITLFFLAGLTFSFLTGCKAEEEKAIENAIASLNGMADELGKIKSVKDITDAKPRLEKAATRMQDAQKEMARLSSQTDTEAMAKKYGQNLSNAQKRIHDEMSRIENELGFAGAGALEELLGK